MAENNNLPEGTDTVIAGASTTSSPNSGNIGGTVGSGGGSTADADLLVVEETRVTAVVPTEGSGGGTGASSGGHSSVIEKLRDGSERVAGQAAGKARDLVGQGLERSAEALANVGRMIGDTAAGLDERLGQEYGDYARRAASAIESSANSLASRDADALIEDTRNFVRKSPTVALTGAAVVGFMLARLVKTGLTGGDEGGDRRGTDDRDA